MEYRRLGNSGTIVTAWCLGTMTFGKEADEATSFALMDAYAQAGGNFIDTADVYSQRRIGGDRRALAQGAADRGQADGGRHQGPLPDGAGAQRYRAVAPASGRGAR